MTHEERAQVIEALAVLAESFRHEVSQALLVTYAMDLSELPLPTVLEAIGQARRRGKFFPSIAELLDLAGASDMDPDYQQVEQMIVMKLRGKAITHPEFLWLVVERLGGWNRTEEMPYLAREQRIKAMLPGVLAAARARGIETPGATTPIAIETNARRALPGPADDDVPDAEVTRALVAKIGRPVP